MASPPCPRYDTRALPPAALDEAQVQARRRHLGHRLAVVIVLLVAWSFLGFMGLLRPVERMLDVWIVVALTIPGLLIFEWGKEYVDQLRKFADFGMETFGKEFLPRFPDEAFSTQFQVR